MTAITIQVNHFAYPPSPMIYQNLNVLIKEIKKSVKDGRSLANAKRKSFGRNVKKPVENAPNKKFNNKTIT